MDKCELRSAYDEVPIDEFLPYIIPYADNLPIRFAKQVLRDALIEFARKTLIIQEDLYADLQTCVTDYALTPPDGYKLHMIRSVCANGTDLRGIEKPNCDGGVRGNRFFFDPPNNMYIGYNPSCDIKDGLKIRSILIPGRKTCGVPEWIFDRYAEDIGNGALSKAMLMKDQEWYDTMQGGIMLRRWKGAIANAKVEKTKNWSAGPTMMKVGRWI